MQLSGNFIELPDALADITGLYARHGWSSSLLLPHLTSDQDNENHCRQRSQVPHIPTEPYSPFSISDLS